MTLKEHNYKDMTKKDLIIEIKNREILIAELREEVAKLKKERVATKTKDYEAKRKWLGRGWGNE